jgi:hypothetical protein
MLFLMLLGCPTAPEPDPSSNLCGTIARDVGEPAATGVMVLEIADGEIPCTQDTGGGGWWGDVVAEPELDGDYFEAEVPVGTYGIEVYTDSDYGGCAEVEVPDTTTCAADVTIELEETIYVDKPNVYLYPEVTSPVRVAIPSWKRITESDPKYPVDGWRAIAHPDGRLETPAGQRDYLFYELTWETDRFQYEEGWCVPGRHAQASVEDAMADLGFLPNEIADFVDAWDATFPTAPWMTVYPQLEGLSPLVIEPAPDQLLRAWFVVAAGCQPVRAPELPSVARVGYHASEWGISFLEPLDRPTVLVEGWR